jgi:hypothetical protein
MIGCPQQQGAAAAVRHTKNGSRAAPVQKVCGQGLGRTEQNKIMTWRNGSGKLFYVLRVSATAMYC